MPNAEKRKELTRQTIIRVKEKIDSEGLSEAEVLQRMLDSGEFISASTVRRFLDENSETVAGFNYNSTVKPFARVFLGLGSTPNDVTEPITEAEKDVAALDNIIQIKNMQIDSLEAQIEDYTKKVEFLKAQVNFKEQQMTSKDALLAERRDFIHRLEEEKMDLRTTLKEERKQHRQIVFVLSLFLCVAILLLFVSFGTDAIIPLFN